MQEFNDSTNRSVTETQILNSITNVNPSNHPFKGQFDIFYANSRSVNNKTNELLLSTNSTDYSAIVFTETWLDPSQNDNEFLDGKYRAFRKDRSQSDVAANRGGGVLIALKNEYDCELYSTPDMLDLEAVCVKVSLSESILFIYCLYIQPSADQTTYDKHLKAINSIRCGKKDQMIILGDWNMPECKWTSNEDGFDLIPILGESQSERVVIARKVTSRMLENEFFQICNLQNKSNNILDLVYTNMPELSLVEKADMLLIPEQREDKSHVQMVCSIECNPKIFKSDDVSKSIFCFKKANYDAINECLSQIDFAALLDQHNVNDMVDAFYSTIYDIFDEFVPKSNIRNSNKPLWFDKKLTNLKNIRNREYKKLSKKRETDPEADETKFVKARDEFDAYQKQRYEEFVKNIMSDSKDNPKKFWQFVNGKRKSNTLPCKLDFNGKVAISDKEKADLFASFFSSVYVTHDTDPDLINVINSRNDHNMFNIVPSPDSVFAVLSSLDINKGASPDKIAPLFLKRCAECLSFPLHLIFSKSISDSTYPTSWKMGQIIPIFKSGKKSDIRNYRGVAIMPTLAKVFEKVSTTS